MSATMSRDMLIQQEQEAFDLQAKQRIKHGFIPDLRRLRKVDWFYNNVWRDPEMVKIHWMPRINQIIAEAKKRGGRVLELGCGFGMLSLELARHGLDVVGIDLSPAHIDIANQFKEENPFKENFGSLEYRCEDIMKSEFEEASFESVIFFRSLHHIAKVDTVLEKVYTSLKPGGNLLISEPIRAHFNQNSALIATLLRTILPTWEGGTPMDGTWDEKRLDAKVTEIFNEYTFDEDHEQSPMDNSLDNADDICAAINKRFEIFDQSFSDAFVDKLIGGLRGDDRYQLARFLKLMDELMIKRDLLPPTSLELHAKKPLLV